MSKAREQMQRRVTTRGFVPGGSWTFSEEGWLGMFGFLGFGAWVARIFDNLFWLWLIFLASESVIFFLVEGLDILEREGMFLKDTFGENDGAYCVEKSVVGVVATVGSDLRKESEVREKFGEGVAFNLGIEASREFECVYPDCASFFFKDFGELFFGGRVVGENKVCFPPGFDVRPKFVEFGFPHQHAMGDTVDVVSVPSDFLGAGEVASVGLVDPSFGSKGESDLDGLGFKAFDVSGTFKVEPGPGDVCK
jgi:hypothetical protein